MYDENDTAEERLIRRRIVGGGLVVIGAFCAILIMIDLGYIAG